MQGKRAFIVAGLGFGDEGKGSVVDWLVRRHGATTVVRTNGGPQAAHHVVDDAGNVFCASQLGAGVLVPGVRAHLARTVVVDPLALLAEDAALRELGVSDALARLSIDPRCVVVTPFHGLVNRMQELARGDARHGSCGRGVGQAQLDAERGTVPCLRLETLRAGGADLAATLRDIRLAKIDLAEQLVHEAPHDSVLRAELEDLRRPERLPLLEAAYADFVRESGVSFSASPALGDAIVIEGAQGVLLDREHGFWPHVTPSRTTFATGLAFLDESGHARTVTRVGVLRAYATRHGAGPFVTEDLVMARAIPDLHNGEDRWQGAFRVGWFDAPAARYAIEAAGGIDALVVTNVDRVLTLPVVRMCSRYEDATDFPRGQKGEGLTRWVREQRPRLTEVAPDVESVVGWLESPEGLSRRVSAISVGPTAAQKSVRRVDGPSI
jgi:adenylosuccinate synthase